MLCDSTAELCSSGGERWEQHHSAQHPASAKEPRFCHAEARGSSQASLPQGKRVDFSSLPLLSKGTLPWDPTVPTEHQPCRRLLRSLPPGARPLHCCGRRLASCTPQTNINSINNKGKVWGLGFFRTSQTATFLSYFGVGLLQPRWAQALLPGLAAAAHGASARCSQPALLEDTHSSRSHRCNRRC